jgi:hypothetical protein
MLYVISTMLFSVLGERASAREKKRELAEIREIFGRRRRTPDATRTHASGVHLTEALVYI